MRTTSKIVLHFVVVSLPFFFAACGMPSSADGLQGRTNQTSTKKTTKKSPTTTTTPSTNTPTTGGTYNPNPTTPTTQQPQQTCTVAQSKVNTLYSSCINTLYDNDDVPGVMPCLSGFQQLTSGDCSSLGSRLNNAFSACRTMFSQYASYLPSSCRSAISALGG